MYNVYAIESYSTSRVYIGQSNAVKKRLKSHNSGYVKSTSNEVPWRIIAIESFKTRNEARWRERQLKKSKGARLRWIKRVRL